MGQFDDLFYKVMQQEKQQKILSLTDQDLKQLILNSTWYNYYYKKYPIRDYLVQMWVKSFRKVIEAYRNKTEITFAKCEIKDQSWFVIKNPTIITAKIKKIDLEKERFWTDKNISYNIYNIADPKLWLQFIDKHVRVTKKF